METCSHKHSQLQQLTYKNTAFYAVVFTVAFGIVEAIFGLWSGSLALLSDAGHMGADALALLLAAFASWIGRRPTTSKHTYGFGRTEAIASWLSSMLLLVVVIGISIEAIERFRIPHTVASKPVIIVAIIGLVINTITAWILNKGEKNLNTRAALFHVFSDLLGSIAVLISGTIIYFTNWTLIDPILSIFICVLIIIGTINLLRESLRILMEGTPTNIDCNKVELTIKSVSGIQTIHDLHIWTLTSGMPLLTAHVVIEDICLLQKIIDDLRTVIQKEFGITHTTIQVETMNQTSPCIDCNNL
ncbi:MAG: hypothetical protein A2V89_01020 [Gammaproteobacteria bacterium RBG_16_37_9]|nr:MAG: hypothetical protein A2V89_01020 [Gammaproteobacteria bacterium RBG_16_37_9]